MGINTHIYTVFGLELPWNDEFHDAYDEVYDDADTPTIIMDGMGGDYMVLGKILYDSGDARYGFEDGDPMKKVEVNELANIEREYKESFVKKFPKYADKMNEPFKLVMFTHYS